MKRRLILAAALAACLCWAAGCKGMESGPEQTAAGQRGMSKAEAGETVADRTQAGDGEKEGGDKHMVQAVYPEMASYPDEADYFDPKTGEFDSDGFSKVFDVWWEEKRSRRELPEGCAESLEPFFAASIRQFLTEDPSGEKGPNRIYSPVNVYLALGMLAETTDGDSRQQILTLLGSDSIEDVRQKAELVWKANYSQDGAVTSVLANSIWLDERVTFREDVLEKLAEHYYASSYWGQMGSLELDERLKSWLNEQTGDLLKEQASGVHMSDDTLMALASAIYFRAKWSEEFSPSNTREEIFHGKNGDLSCEFMHQGGTKTYYWGEKFGAVNKSLQESGGMWLILPDEGVTPEEVLGDDEVMELLLSGKEWENQKFLVVNLAMPKFDVVSNIDLREGLKSLGVTDVFDSGSSDFSPLTGETEGIFVSQASHAARVMVDEEGCIAAAYTVMAAAGAAMPPQEEMDFVLDRPFVFVITGDSGMPLFAGIVGEP